MSEARDQLVEDARRILKNHTSGSDLLTGALIETIERLLDQIEKPWLTECDRHVDSLFRCMGCTDEDLETIREHVSGLRAVHPKVEIVGDLPGIVATVAICTRCRERWPCQTMAAVEGASEEIGKRSLREPTS